MQSQRAELDEQTGSKGRCPQLAFLPPLRNLSPCFEECQLTQARDLLALLPSLRRHEVNIKLAFLFSCFFFHVSSGTEIWVLILARRMLYNLPSSLALGESFLWARRRGAEF